MNITSQYPIVLASTSAIRKELLEHNGITFTIAAPTVDENALKPELTGLPIPIQALELAKAKGFSIADEYPEHLIIASDQICEQDGEILSKPGSHENAVAQLTKLQSRSHVQHSAACIIKNQTCLFEHIDCAQLYMRGLSPEEIETYLQADKPYQSCGSYRLEGYGKHLFHAIEGSDDVVKGFPLIALLDHLYSSQLLKFTA